jgi:hypothetical protein
MIPLSVPTPTFQPIARASPGVRHGDDFDRCGVDAEKHDVWEALEQALSIRSIGSPDWTRFGILEDGLERSIHDGH